MRRMLKLIVVACAISLVPLTLAGGAAAGVAASGAAASTAETFTASTGTEVSTDVDDFAFDSLDVDYTLGRAEDGTSTLLVQERFVAVFPDYDQNRGMRRSIPDSYLGAPLDPELISITDEEGNPREAEAESDDGEFMMTSRADDYVRGAQTYVFTYRLHNVTRGFTDTGADEFYWDVNGDEWNQQFGRVTARVLVPADLAGSLTGAQSCYVGYAGSEQQCEITAEPSSDSSATGGGTTVTASADGVLAYQTLTIAIAFEPGTFTPFDSSYLGSVWGWLQLVTVLGAIAAAVFAGITRARHLRDGSGRPTIIAEYSPPAQVDALESAVLLGRPGKAIPAEVLEQAVVGSIRIVEGARKLFGGVKLKAQLIDPSKADGDGRMLLGGLFSPLTPGAEFEFGSSDTRLSKTAQSILALAEKELFSRGLRRQVPISTRMWPVLLAVVAAVVVTIFGVLALNALVDPFFPVILIAVAILCAVLAATLVSHKPLTAEGADVRDHLKGLSVFIDWAEADRIRMLQSPAGAERVRIDPGNPAEMLKLYEVLLPYAVVFGHEKKWAEQLAVLYGSGNSPGWYTGTNAFSAASFSSGIGTLSASSSSASSSGGSSGGGSAGGGGGGGGGGGV